MMLTFEDYAEIPESLHEFYRIAFDTLLRRHDAMKGQFLRQSHSSCSTEQFKQIFASFCLLTYTKSAFSFDRDRAIAYLKAALAQQGINKEPEDVLADFVESICLLHQEGFEVSFVHRSFQEYFCAVFVANAATGFVGRYLNEVDVRTYDNVLPMLMGIAQQRVESEWACQRVAEIAEQFPIDDPGAKLQINLVAYPKLQFMALPGRVVLVNLEQTRLARDLRILMALYQDVWDDTLDDITRSIYREDLSLWDARIASEFLKLDANGDKALEAAQRLVAEEDHKTSDDERMPIEIIAKPEHEPFLRALFTRAFDARIEFIHAVRAEQSNRQSRSNAFLGEVFGNMEV